MLLRTSVLCTLVILTLSCCAGLVSHDELSHSGHMSRVILIKDGDEDEKKYQQALERTGDNPGYLQLRRKPLVREDLDNNLIPTSDSERRRQNHGRRRHRTPSDTESDRADVNVMYDENDSDYRPAQSPSHHKKDTHKNDRTRKTKNEKTVSLVRRLPQAIIIGVKKGGTRALLEFLRMHPDVRAPGPEPHFFDRNYDKGLDWYRRQMPPTSPAQVTMEKTPSYFVTKGVPGRIFNMSKNVRFIVVVRDPVTRAISDYAQALAKRDNISSFEEMALEDNTTGLVDTSWGAIRIGVYAKHLERWLQYFPLSQMHFVSGERLITDPAGEMGKVQDFLGLDRVITDKNFLFNNTKGFPCLVRPDRVRKMPHCLSKTKGREHPKIDFKVLQRLRDFFRPFNQKFYQMVGYDFGWS